MARAKFETVQEVLTDLSICFTDWQNGRLAGWQMAQSVIEAAIKLRKLLAVGDGT